MQDIVLGTVIAAVADAKQQAVVVALVGLDNGEHALRFTVVGADGPPLVEVSGVEVERFGLLVAEGAEVAAGRYPRFRVAGADVAPCDVGTNGHREG